MRPVEQHDSSYQVVVQGTIGPAVLASCDASRTGDSQISSVFQLRAQNEQTIADLAATVQSAGLMILSIRLVTTRETWAVAAVPV